MDEIQQMKIKNFKYLNQIASKGATLFTGSSLMEMFPVCEIARSENYDQIIYNRGVGGLNTDEFLENINALLLDLEPSKIFINIGTNERKGRLMSSKIKSGKYAAISDTAFSKSDNPIVSYPDFSNKFNSSSRI